MGPYVIRRVVQGVVTLWVAWSLLFVAYFVAPEDPASMLCRIGCPQIFLNRIREELGLNLPLWQQYLNYFGRILHGNLGYSYVSGEPVTTIVARAVPVDLSLAIPAGVIWLTVGLGLGIMAARHPNSARARAATLFVFAGLSVPTFIVGIALLDLFDGVLIRWLGLFPPPGSSWTPFLTNPTRVGARPGAPLDHARVRLVGNVAFGLRGARCETCSERTTSPPPVHVASRSGGSSTVMRSMRRSRR